MAGPQFYTSYAVSAYIVIVAAISVVSAAMLHDRAREDYAGSESLRQPGTVAPPIASAAHQVIAPL